LVPAAYERFRDLFFHPFFTIIAERIFTIEGCEKPVLFAGR